MIKVVGPRLLVKLEKLEEVDPVYKSARQAGIVIERTDHLVRQEQAVTYGTVLQTTELCWQAPVGDGTPWCIPGDFISFAKYAGKYIKEPGSEEEFLIIMDEDVVAVISKEIKDE